MISDSSVRKIYKNPPVAEAIVEIGFVETKKWNPAVPGQLFDLVGKDYPEDPQQTEIIEAKFSDGDSPAETMLNVQTKSQRLVFRNGPQLLMVGTSTLSLHSLSPYEGWESFRERILKAVRAYRTLRAPEAIARIGLRYVNRVEIPSSTISFSDYFTVAQGLPPEGFPSDLHAFFDRMELSYDDIPAKIIFTWASTKAQKESASAFVLDFDLRWTEPCSFDEFENRILEDLRDRERLAFESLIQDNLRVIFNAG